MSSSGHAQDTHLSPEESTFNDCLRRGDEFMKIEIFRQAKTWYLKAIQMFPDNPEAKDKLEVCQKKLKSESKTIITILSIAAIIILVVVLV